MNCKHSRPLNNISLNSADSLIHGFLSPANTLENVLEVCSNVKQLPRHIKGEEVASASQEAADEVPDLTKQSNEGKDISPNRCLMQMRVPYSGEKKAAMSQMSRCLKYT